MIIYRRASRYIFLVVSIVLGSQVTWAQEIKSPVEQVNYSRSIPLDLGTYIPKGGKSRFWGETKLKYENKPVWAHFYDVKKADFPKDARYVDDNQHSGLDLFIFPNPRHLKRISTTRFSYGRYGDYRTGAGLELVGLKSLWLDPLTKRMPILQLDLINPNSILMPISKEILFVYAKGVANKPSPERGEPGMEQGFGYGNSNDGNGWDTSYSDADERGLTAIIHHISSMDFHENTFYHWVDNHFKPFKVEKGPNQIFEGN